VTFATLVVVVGVGGWSYGGYLTASGDAPVTVRTVDWARDHGFSSIVADIEQWWYTHHKPTGTRPHSFDIPPATRVLASQVTASAPGARWVAVEGLAAPTETVQETFVQPDRRYRSVAVSLVRIDQRSTRLVLVAGTKDPGGRGWPWMGGVPIAARSKLIAAFNAGFQFRDTPGGFYTMGRTGPHPLTNGIASVVIYKDGHADVAQWGRDAMMTADVVSVRQNLALIVDHGVSVGGLQSNGNGRWGTKKSQFQYTWRSGLGVTADGRLIYAVGRQMSLNDLAAALVDGGAVRAMELDMHGIVNFNWFRPHHQSPPRTRG